MSENKEKDFTERFNTLKDEALKAMKETTETVLKKLDTEKRKAEILDQAAERGAQLIRQHQQDWEAHRQVFGVVPTDFESGKHAKISAEMLKIRHDGERTAYGLNEPGTSGEVKIVIERENVSR